jgi:hypothetical protein
MTAATEIAHDLRQHLALCQDILAVVEREHLALREAGAGPLTKFQSARQSFLARLEESLGTLRSHRARWQRLAPATRAHHPETAALLRANQDLITRILALDRENEQTLLRRGLVPPRHLPPAGRQQPQAAAALYRRAAGSSKPK